MKYREAVTYVKQIQAGAKIKPGLEVTRKLMKLLGDPQSGLSFVHVAGTNGKGSTAAFISSMAAAAGWKVGRFVSPAVFSERESIRYELDGETVYITEEEMAGHLTAIRAAIEQMARCGDGIPTEFEIETAAAFLAFSEWQCDLVVLETGMGGLLDATNIVTTTACAVITPVAMDHMKFLGDTIERIAAQKAGIIKEHVPVVMCQHDEAAAACLIDTCRERGCEWSGVSREEIHMLETTLSGTRFDYKQYRDLRISVSGLYQVENACLAIECVEMLNTQLAEHSLPAGDFLSVEHFSSAGDLPSAERSLPAEHCLLTEEQIRRGLAAARWRGRFEVISETPCVVVDGAHNPDGMKVFLNSVRTYFEEKEKIAVMGVFADKDYHAMARLIGSTFSRIYTVTPPSERALAAEELASALNGAAEADGNAAWRDEAPVIAAGASNVEKTADRAIACGTLSEAFDMAKQHRNAVIFVFGSLSLLKGAYDYWD